MPRTQSWNAGKITQPSDPEFAAKVRAQIGAPYQQAVDPAAATFVDTGDRRLNVKGMYFPSDTSQLELDENALNLLVALARMDPAMARNAPSYQADHVYSYGPWATPQTWGHEFRHRAGMESETENRTLDAYYAGSRPAWDEAVVDYLRWRQQTGQEEQLGDLIRRLAYRDSYTNSGQPNERTASEAATGVKGSFLDFFLDRQRWDAQRKVNAPWRHWVTEEQIDGR